MSEAPSPPATHAADLEGVELDRRRGARPGDVRFRRVRGHRRGVLESLRSLPGAIRRASPFA